MSLRAASKFMTMLTSRHRTVLINGGVGFVTFAVGDILAQGAHPPSMPLLDYNGNIKDAAKDLSWLQRFVKRMRRVDVERSAKVGLLGVALNGWALGTWYKILDRYLGANRKNIKSIVAKCLADQLVFAPFSIVSFISCASVLNAEGFKPILREIQDKLRENFLSTWLMDCKVWPPANLVIFRFIPSPYRPSCASLVQVAWQAYLSTVTFSPGTPPSITQTSTNPVVIEGREGEGGFVGSLPAGVTTTSRPIRQQPLQRRKTCVGYSFQRRRTSRYAYFGRSEAMDQESRIVREKKVGEGRVGTSPKGETGTGEETAEGAVSETRRKEL